MRLSETLSAETIRSGLRTQFVGQEVYYWPVIDSTNEKLKYLADEGAPEGTLAIADQQVAGRGRMNRKWIAPAGSSLLMSLLFRPTFLSPTRAQQLTMVCSLAAVNAVEQVTGLSPDLKWPNDLLLNGKKLAGVLTELGFAGDVLSWVTVGVGLNVNLDFTAQALHRDWPELAQTAISLSMALRGRLVPRLPLLHSYLADVEARYDALRSGHSPHQEWAARLVTLGREVTVDTPEGAYRGVAQGVDVTGAILLRQPDGRVTRILAGDVTHQAGGEW